MIQTTFISSCISIVSTGSGNSIFGSFSVSLFNAKYIQISSIGAIYNPTTGKLVGDGLWHTVLVTYDGTTLYVYVDGRLDNIATNWNVGGLTTAIATTLNTIGNSANYIGADTDGNSNRWIGSLKNVNVYDYVVSNAYALAKSYQAAGSLIYSSGNK